jgi:hypothetical protein
MATYEGKWRCTFCHTVCRGREMNCVGCGARRGADVEFFLNEDAQPLMGGALLREAHDGPDWLCETCGGSNRFSVKTCQTCGAPCGSSSFRRVTDTYSNNARGVDGTALAVPRRGLSLTLICVVGAGLIVVTTFFCLAVIVAGGSAQKAFPVKTDPRHSVSRNVDLVVERVEWKRSVVIEEYRDVVSEDWEDSVPTDARVISQRQDVHHHDRVKVGSHVVQENYTERVKVSSHTVTENYTDREYSGTERYQCGTRNRGNGYFETVYCMRPVYRTVTKSRSKVVDDYQTVARVRDKTVDDYRDVPVYRLKIKYSVKRWVSAETQVAQGTDLAPRWPEVVGGPAHRAGQRSESYLVSLRDPKTNKVYNREVSAEEFVLFTASAKCAATVNGFDQIVALTPPKTEAAK